MEELSSKLETFLKSLEIKELEEIVYCPLLEQSQISGNRIFFIKDWYDKSIRNIIDIITENGLIYDFEDLKHKYNIKGTFLDYTRLLRNIPKSWKEIISVEPDKCAKLKYNVQANCYVKFILKTKEGVETYMTHLYQWAKQLSQSNGCKK